MASISLEVVPCLLCGSPRHGVFLKDVPELYVGTGHLFDIVKCSGCGFTFTNPRPCKKDIGMFYPDSSGYYANKAGSDDITGRFSGISGALKRLVLARVFGYRHLFPSAFWIPAWALRPLLCFGGDPDMPQYRAGGRLFEIGCSTGGYLKKMETLGWHVSGVELNAAAADFARDKLGLPGVRQGFFEDQALADGSFEVVKASMVLEHVYDPRDFVKHVARVLVPGGDFIFSVPDIDGLEIRWYGRHAYCLQVPQHISHFSVRTVTALLEQEGFEVVRVRHHSFDRDLVASANYAGRKTLAAILHHRVIRKLLVAPFVGLLAALGKTSRMTVYARKAAR